MEHLGLAIENVRLDEPMAKAHQHYDIELNFVRQGQMTLFCHDQSVLVGAGEVVLFWAACLHRITAVDPDTRMTWVTLGLNSFLSWNLPENPQRKVLEGGILLDRTPPEKTGDEAALQRWLEDKRDAEARELFLEELRLRVCRVFRAAEQENPIMRNARTGRSSARSAAAKGELLPKKVETMARFMVRHHTDAITVDEIARAAGLHRNYATQAFRRYFGMSLKEQLTRQRITTAQRLLSTTSLSVQEIAYASGFQAPSRFYEAFRKRTALSPRDYRRGFQPNGDTEKMTS